ncbi:MAG: phosphate ABC transporter ATP-binding protein PstB [Selenomonadaceae bacterium]|nr:phosphate ABC transporter ATP-binding protein PstB [Selenomonadaceae bacterium]
MNEILRINNLNLWYDSKQALQNINMRIYEHEITALIGASGCGKSTFLRTLDRLHDLTPIVRITGEVLYKGQNIYDPDIAVTQLRKQIGMIFQKPNPFPMSIYDNVAYGPRTHGISDRSQLDDIVENALRGAALWDEVKDRLRSSALGLSGGQQQRLCIARSLAVEPNIILMDESTSALDPISTGKIEELALKLKERYTVIMVTHNMQQARRISDRCAFFWLGEMVECAPTDQLFNQPKDVRTKLYVSGSMG